MRVLHVFDHSLPHHSGYSFRSASILRALNARGIDTVQVTGPEHAHAGPVREVVGGLGFGVPLIYEVRACWEDAAVSSGTTVEGSARYRASRALETFVARRADSLVVICDGLQREFIARGIPPSRVNVVGNAINPQALPEVDTVAAARLRESLGLTGKRIIGFFGSFYDYEGLNLLIQSLPAVLQSVPNAVIVLAGGGESESAIQQDVERLGLTSQVRLLGRVPHEQIGDCYGMADVMVFPRLQQRLTDMVTPLKPLEAMYLRTPVVASDVGGHRELIRHETTGMLFEAGNAAALAGQLTRVLSDDRLAAGLIEGGYEYVTTERLWPHMAELYEKLYRQLLEHRGAAVSARR